MKINPIKLFRLALLISAFQLFSFSAFPQLTTVVYPGYTIQPGERITIDKLNLLGSPTVVVSGTSTGSVVSAGSITSSSITTNAFDQLSILGGYDGAAATTIRVNYNTNHLYLYSTGLGYKTNSVGNTHFATNDPLAWSKITLSTNIIPLTNTPFATSSNVIHANSNGVPAALIIGSGLLLTNNTLQFSNATSFTTAEYEIATGRTATNHALGSMPLSVRWVFVCKTNDVGYAAGEEVDAADWSDANASSFTTTGASATNIFIAVSTPAATLYCVNGTTGAANANPTVARWRLKGYARP